MVVPTAAAASRWSSAGTLLRLTEGSGLRDENERRIALRREAGERFADQSDRLVSNGAWIVGDFRLATGEFSRKPK